EGRPPRAMSQSTLAQLGASYGRVVEETLRRVGAQQHTSEAVEELGRRWRAALEQELGRLGGALGCHGASGGLLPAECPAGPELMPEALPPALQGPGGFAASHVEQRGAHVELPGLAPWLAGGEAG
ncbi:unnamed protein product, partial [Prorocentrum cordatum]